MPRWFTCPQTVTHVSTNRARRRATTLIEHNVLTTRPHHRTVCVTCCCLSVCLCVGDIADILLCQSFVVR